MSRTSDRLVTAMAVCRGISFYRPPNLTGDPIRRRRNEESGVIRLGRGSASQARQVGVEDHPEGDVVLECGFQ
jgi:hypothetical protein